jgi:two-component system NtrC family sensor kinase
MIKKRMEKEPYTISLEEQLAGLEALGRIGRKVTASLDLDHVLTAVVDAAVELTGAEEGSILLLDEASGEIYMHAARNFQEDFVRTFRVPVEDTLPGEVLSRGKPLLLNEETPKKIKTAYFVHTLMYVPMIVKDHPIGVLGVDNRSSGQSFSQHQLNLVSALADYAAIAVENARLYNRAELEQKKLTTLISKVKDGVIVVDQDMRLMLINQSARQAFGLDDGDLTGKPIEDVFQNNELLEILSEVISDTPYRSEISLPDGRVLNAQITPIPEIGLAVTMQDITQLKELDQVKNDFVSMVSHDLRSPLTAILGYVALIERVGPVNEDQKKFIRLVDTSVQSVTELIDELLDLGRIEAGLDERRELIQPKALIHSTTESFLHRVKKKSQTIELEIEPDLPRVLGNPTRLRQMLSNLIGNAIKYSPEGSLIKVRAETENGQVILQVSDNGIGIPLADQVNIFDKFFRASNVPEGIPGTGLGLAIVKSIVENHGGRIWVDSSPGQGAVFFVVLPVLG